MIKQIIPAFSKEDKPIPKEVHLRVSEFYYDTLQGEGATLGTPSAFLRLQGCTMNCSYCDTKEVWRSGNPYSITELMKLIEKTELPKRLKEGQHLILTGGSPLLQQEQLFQLMVAFFTKFRFTPIVEIENECTILPNQFCTDYIVHWNNSPKLESSGVPLEVRYKPNIIKYLAGLNKGKKSWFKFVVKEESQWEEIDSLYLSTNLIQRDQIILMPEGCTRKELEKNQNQVIQMAVRQGVRYSPREHIVLWDKSIGV
jgi:organic radical activating enzyme